MPHQQADERVQSPATKPLSEATHTESTSTERVKWRDLSHLDRALSTRGAQQPQAAQHSATRLTPVDPVLDVGEQLFGSSHVFEIPAPFNIGVSSGTANLTSVVAAPDGTFSLDSSPSTLGESARMSGAELGRHLASPFRVRFAPVADGEFPKRMFAAELRVSARWEDGHVEVATVQLRGRARRIEDKPNATRTVAELVREQTDQQKAAEFRQHEEALLAESRHRVEPYPQGAVSAFNNAYEGAKKSAEQIAKGQNAGLQNAADAIGSYMPPPVKPSIWWDLAAGALLIGTSGVAGVVGGLVAKQLVKSVTNKAATRLTDGIAGAIKNGLKVGAERAVDAVKPKPDAQVSTAQKLQFFESQRKALVQMAGSNAELVGDRKAHLEPLLATEPQLAIDAMTAIDNSLDDAAQAAIEHQQRATSAAWLALRGRMALGTEQLSDTKETVTNLDRLRTASGSSPGLLELILDTGQAGPRVISASVRGISRATAETLCGIELATAPVPLRLVVGWNVPDPAIIVRDEAGRIRVSGDFNRLAMFDVDGARISSEVQAERAARRALDAALSRPLAGWGAHITTDDQSATG